MRLERTLLCSLTLAAVALAPALASAEEGYGKTEGIIPGVVFGPKLSIVAENPGIGVEAKIENRVGIAFDYGYVPDTSIQSVKIGWSDPSVALKVYPFAGRFYVGAAYGQRSFRARARDDVGLEVGAKVTTTYVAPQLGWNVVWKSGFFMQWDLGYQLVLSHSAHLDIPIAADPGTTKDVDDATRRIGKTGLPVIGLLRLGWFL